MSAENILVVITGELERLVPALGAIAAIRAAHAEAHLVVLADAKFAEFLETSPYPNEVWVDATLGSRNLKRWLDLRVQLR